MQRTGFDISGGGTPVGIGSLAREAAAAIGSSRISRATPVAMALVAMVCAVPSSAVADGGAAHAPGSEPGLLFRYSADHGLAADFAHGDPQPNFADKVKVIPDGKAGPGLQAAGDQVLSWQAGANIFAQRGTLSFFWRARDPIGQNPFPLFRVGYADHTSWDMVWLRMDWNGHGIDAFVAGGGRARGRGAD